MMPPASFAESKASPFALYIAIIPVSGLVAGRRQWVFVRYVQNGPRSFVRATFVRVQRCGTVRFRCGPALSLRSRLSA